MNALWKRKKRIDTILIVIGLLLFGYTTTRAYLLSFTYDEATTYLQYVHKGKFILTNYHAGDANNHLLNTWLMELTSKLFGINEFVLRLPNLFSHILFLFFSAKLVRKLSSSTLIICSYILINVNPFLLDFFSLARGYGLSMGFTMASLYFAYKFIVISKLYKTAFISVLLGSLAVLSYFSLLNYFLTVSFLLMILNGIYNSQQKKSLKEHINSLIILSPFLCLLFILPIMFHLKSAGGLNFGGEAGFWHDSVVTLLYDLFWFFPKLDLVVTIFQVFVIIILASAILIVLKECASKNTLLQNSFLIFLLCMTFFLFLGNYIEHKKMGILYPRGRYALFYFPFFTLVIIFLFENILRKYSKFSKSIMVALTIFILINFSFAANFNKVQDWSDEADVKKAMVDLVKFNNNSSEKKDKVTICSRSNFFESISFYKSKLNLSHLIPIKTEPPFFPAFDYYYIDQKDTLDFPSISFKITKQYPATHTLLISNEEHWKMSNIFYCKYDFDSNTPHFDHLTDEIAYSGQYSSKADSNWNCSGVVVYIVGDSMTRYKNLFLKGSMAVYLPHLSSDAFIAASFEDSLHRLYSWQTFNATNNIYHDRKWTIVEYAAIVPSSFHKGDIIKCYLFNDDKKNPVYVDDFEFKIVAYEKQ